MPGLSARTLRIVLAATLLIIVGALLVPGSMLWSERDRDQEESLTERISQLSSRRSLQFPRFTAVERPAGLSPLGDFEPSLRAPAGRPDLVPTALGWIRVGQPDSLLAQLPPDLRASGRSIKTVAGKGRLWSGVNILQIERAALDRLPYGSIEAEIVAAGGRILGVLPNRALMVRPLTPEAVEALGRLPFVERTGIYEPAYKISPLVGRMPLIERDRALSPILQLDVQIWPDADSAIALARLRTIVGPENILEAGLDGRVYRVRADRAGIVRLAKEDLTASLSESPEYMLSDAETPSIIMIGTFGDSFNGARPFHDLGIDGGGLDTDGDGQRLNDGSDAVPPQIVAVTDNGLSLDAVHLSHTSTQPTIPFIAPVGPKHRKVHALQDVADPGLASCDATLSGASTHGNVIAGIIAGNPGELGFRYTFPGGPDPAVAPELETFSLDAVARGSRILMQDAASPSVCSINELVETGGNVSPGFLIDRLNLAICPKGGGDGACQDIVGGDAEVHLHVMPFGTPNFDNIVFNTSNGTYPLSSHQIDRFLVNNLDYMVFVPVGNQGNLPADGGQLALPIWPDLFNGTASDNDPNQTMNPLQISPPATAKNIVSVGASFTDAGLTIGLGAEFPMGYSSHGPATAASLRMAPLVTAVGDNFSGFGASYIAATLRSRDNDNSLPVENEIDPQNRGTSFSSGFATAAGALVRDYYAQGFYPTANRLADDRMPDVSGSLVRAALVASANFGEHFFIPARTLESDLLVANSRAVQLGIVAGDNVGVIGNGVQGFGRIVLDQVLPLSNYPPTRGVGVPTVEYPATGSIVYDMLGTGEAPIDNFANTMTVKT
ncbi:MAG: S8 family serine peptidase, partial [Acidobacteria bacterium]|nr:S8 family serine peptidase [Acidobacteriota bacterium]